jgi:proline dehydrogenase
MLRSTLLYLSRLPALRRWMETSPVAEPLTHRFVAGQTLDEAIAVCRKVNAEGIDVALDHLGENVTSLEEAAESRDQVLQAVAAIERERLRSTVAVKLTQFGLDLGVETCRANLRPLFEQARRAGTRVEIDMEASEYVDRTLQIVHEMHQEWGCVRAVIQAYLHRSKSDIQALNAARIPVRLCKGAYREPASVALQNPAEIDRNYLELADLLLAGGVDPAFATHDEAMMRPGRAADPKSFEFQMLYGVRRDLQKRLVREGFRLRLYVPYGDAWYPYFMRRMAERPANLWFVAQSVLRG